MSSRAPRRFAFVRLIRLRPYAREASLGGLALLLVLATLFIGPARTSASPLAGPSDAVPVPLPTTHAPPHRSPRALAARGPQHRPHARPAPDPAVLPAASTYYARRYTVSQHEARRRLTLQTMAPNLPKFLANAVPGFSSLWFDNARGTWVVAVTRGTSAAKVHAIMAKHHLGHAYRVVRTPAPHATPATAARTLAKRLTDIVSPTQVTVGVGAGQVDVTLAATVSRPLRGRVRAALTTTVPITLKVVPPRFLRAARDATCAFPSCDTLLAGMRWSDGLRGCSTGFLVGSRSTSNTYLLTAGHCVTVGQRWWVCKPYSAGCEYAGEEVARRFGGANGDAGLLRIDDPWPVYAGYADWAAGTIRPVRSWWSTSVPVNTVVCLNGSGGGTTCGTVSDTNVTIGYGSTSLTGMIRVTGVCVGPGDSGAPWTTASGDSAVGIHSGSTRNPNGCDSPAYVDPVGRAVRQFDSIVYGYP